MAATAENGWVAEEKENEDDVEVGKEKEETREDESLSPGALEKEKENEKKQEEEKEPHKQEDKEHDQEWEKRKSEKEEEIEREKEKEKERQLGKGVVGWGLAKFTYTGMAEGDLCCEKGDLLLVHSRSSSTAVLPNLKKKRQQQQMQMANGANAGTQQARGFQSRVLHFTDSPSSSPRANELYLGELYLSAGAVATAAMGKTFDDEEDGSASGWWCAAIDTIPEVIGRLPINYIKEIDFEEYFRLKKERDAELEQSLLEEAARERAAAEREKALQRESEVKPKPKQKQKQKRVPLATKTQQDALDKLGAVQNHDDKTKKSTRSWFRRIKTLPKDLEGVAQEYRKDDKGKKEKKPKKEKKKKRPKKSVSEDHAGEADKEKEGKRSKSKLKRSLSSSFVEERRSISKEDQGPKAERVKLAVAAGNTDLQSIDSGTKSSGSWRTKLMRATSSLKVTATGEMKESDKGTAEDAKRGLASGKKEKSSASPEPSRAKLVWQKSLSSRRAGDYSTPTKATETTTNKGDVARRRGQTLTETLSPRQKLEALKQESNPIAGSKSEGCVLEHSHRQCTNDKTQVENGTTDGKEKQGSSSPRAKRPPHVPPLAAAPVPPRPLSLRSNGLISPRAASTLTFGQRSARCATVSLGSSSSATSGSSSSSPSSARRAPPGAPASPRGIRAPHREKTNPTATK